MTTRQEPYALNRKPRHTGDWWKPRTQRLEERKAVKAQRRHWIAKAGNPSAFTKIEEGIFIVPSTPLPEQVGAVLNKQRLNWLVPPQGGAQVQRQLLTELLTKALAA